MAESRTILVFDTSTAFTVVASRRDDSGESLIAVEDAGRHARGLIPLLARHLERAGVAPRNLRVIGVGVGPGSFTGLRVGVTTAKTLGYALGIPVVGLPSLEAIAAGVADAGSGRIAAVVEAQRGDWAVGWFRGPTCGQAPIEIGGVEVRSAREVLDELRAGDMVAGPALERLVQAGGVKVGVGVNICRAPHPQGEALLRMLERRLGRGRTEGPLEVAPLYARRSAAEEKAEGGAPR